MRLKGFRSFTTETRSNGEGEGGVEKQGRVVLPITPGVSGLTTDIAPRVALSLRASVTLW